MSPDRLRVLYLHGFASSPKSRKAAFIMGRLRGLGVEVEAPDLAAGDFEHLTISGQLRIVADLARNEPVSLIGSSLGGYLAALYAARHPKVERLVLFAPAFRFRELWAAELGPERMSRWKETGALSVFHYGAGCEMQIGYQLMEDASRFEAFPEFEQPTLILHGDRDNVVPVRQSVEFAESHPNVRMVRLPSDHELGDVLERIWQETKSFLLGGKHQIGC